MNSEYNTKLLRNNAINVDLMYIKGMLWADSNFCFTYVDERKRLARWKKRALYLTWNTEGSSKLYNFL